MVTGGTGLIGKILVNSLRKRSCELTLLVRENYVSNDDHKHEKLHFIRGDITDRESLVKVVNGFDTVVHLAASLRMFEKHHELEKTNVDGLRNILYTYCSSGRPVNFIFASSIDAVVRNSDYAASKRKGEQIIRQFARKHPMFNYAILRIGNVYHEKKGGYEKMLTDLMKTDYWKASLIYHLLPNKKIYPIAIDKLTKKINAIVFSQKSDQVVNLYDRPVQTKETLDKFILEEKLNAPIKIPFSKLMLASWLFLGKLLKRGDLLIYFALEK